MLVMHYSYGEVIGGVKTRGIVDEAHMCDGFLLSILLRILHCKNILATSIFFLVPQNLLWRSRSPQILASLLPIIKEQIPTLEQLRCSIPARPSFPQTLSSNAPPE
jgi:hypothetical protein